MSEETEKLTHTYGVSISDSEKVRANAINEKLYHGALKPTSLVHEIFKAGLSCLESGYPCRESGAKPT